MASTFLQQQNIRVVPKGSRINGVDNKVKYDASSQLVRGTLTFSRNHLKDLDPSYTGYTQIFVLKMPYFMERLVAGAQIDSDPDVIADAKYHYDNLKALIELGSTSYSGTPDLSMETTTLNLGYQSDTLPVPTLSSYNGQSFNITCIETRSEPLRQAGEWYISSITDPVGHYTHYNGAVDDAGIPLQPLLSYHTYALLVVQTDSSMLGIQDACIWNAAFFTTIQRDNLNWTLGTVDAVAPKDMSWEGKYVPNVHKMPGMLEYISDLLATRYLFYKRSSEITIEDLGLTI